MAEGVASWQAWAPAAGLRLLGADRVGLLHRLTSQDLRPLAAPGQVARALCLTPKGRLVDWVEVASAPDALWVATSPGRAARVAAWIEGYTICEDVTCEVVPDGAFARLLWVGAHPEARRALGLSGAGAFFAAVPADAAPSLWTPALDAWGEGLEAWVPAAAALACRDALAAVGAAPITPEAHEHRRLVAGIPGPAGEYPAEASPLELRLAATSVAWSGGCYVGQEVISRLDSYRKVARLLVGVRAPSARPAPGEAAPRLWAGGRPAGQLTSWAIDGGGLVGLARVRAALAAPGDVEIEAGGARAPAQLTLPPFCRPPAGANG